MRVAVVGGVQSTEVLTRSLVKHGFSDIAVWGYVPNDTKNVSGWCDLQALSDELALPFHAFRKVTECEEGLRAFAPDVLFVVGLSQIIPAAMLEIAPLANVGFHPTALPHGRGRAAIAWLILHRQNGAASFFQLGSGVDDGPIFVQEPFQVAWNDDAADVEAKILDAESRALDRWLPVLRASDVVATKQDHTQATWLGRRTPDDGWLDWSQPREAVLALIRASAPPHPGAFTYCAGARIEILAATLCDRPETGVIGRIVAVQPDGRFEIQAGDGLITVERWASATPWRPKTGLKLGYYVETEVFGLMQKIATLEDRIADLERCLDSLRHGVKAGRN